ncbi:hypothetical protein OXX59_009945, partial [Metschnikowia pulcherrima]
TWCPITAEPTSTKTNVETTIVTITSCHDNKCHESTVAATQGPTTVTTNGETTVYTTWCPISSTEAGKTTVWTSASTGANGEATTVTVTATEGPTTATVNGE